MIVLQGRRGSKTCERLFPSDAGNNFRNCYRQKKARKEKQDRSRGAGDRRETEIAEVTA